MHFISNGYKRFLYCQLVRSESTKRVPLKNQARSDVPGLIIRNLAPQHPLNPYVIVISRNVYPASKTDLAHLIPCRAILNVDAPWVSLSIGYGWYLLNEATFMIEPNIVLFLLFTQTMLPMLRGYLVRAQGWYLFTVTCSKLTLISFAS